MMMLISYAYARKNERWLRFVDRVHSRVELMIDSGAFSVKNAGQTIPLQEYIDWCLRHESKLWGYVQLDVIRNQKKSIENLDTMAKAGLRPMPVLTADAPESLMPHFVSVNPRVCVAGGTDESSDYYMARIERAFRASGGKARIHGLGYTRGIEVVRTRVKSVDSSSWNTGVRYGTFRVFDRLTGWRSYRISEFKKTPFHRHPEFVKNYLINSGVGADIVTKPEFFHGRGAFLAVATAAAALDYQSFCAGRGIRNFLAVAAWSDLAVIALAMHHRTGFATGIDWAGVCKDAPFVVDAVRGNLDAFFDYFIDGVEHAGIRCCEDAVRGSASLARSAGMRIVSANSASA